MHTSITTTNGLAAYGLLSVQGSVVMGASIWECVYQPSMFIGIRVYKRSAGGTDTEITAGTMVASLYFSGADESAWKASVYTPGATTLAPTDTIVVRVGEYIMSALVARPTKMIQSFQTDQLNAQKLSAATWSIVIGGFTYDTGISSQVIGIRWGSGLPGSTRIANFMFDLAPSGRKQDTIILTKTPGGYFEVNTNPLFGRKQGINI